MDDRAAVDVVLEAAEHIRQLTDQRIEDTWTMTPGDASTAGADSASHHSHENTRNTVNPDDEEFDPYTDPASLNICEGCE